MLKRLYRPIIGTAALLALTAIVAGCAQKTSDVMNGDILNSASENLLRISVSRGDILTPNFTTKNRPTKTVEIGGQDFEIFNPAQDEEFLSIYNQYSDACMKSDINDNSCHQIRRYVEYNHFLQSLDIVKAGCVVFERTNGAVYHFYPKTAKNAMEFLSDYPAEHYNPFPNFRHSNRYFPALIDFEAKVMFYDLNGKSFFKTAQTKFTSTFYTSEDAKLDEAFEFECLLLTTEID